MKQQSATVTEITLGMVPKEAMNLPNESDIMSTI
jgi:hypothetical protein